MSRTINASRISAAELSQKRRIEESLQSLLLLDNDCLGMVRQQQDMFWDGRRHAVDLGATPDWPSLAASFGGNASSKPMPHSNADSAVHSPTSGNRRSAARAWFAFRMSMRKMPAFA